MISKTKYNILFILNSYFWRKFHQFFISSPKININSVEQLIVKLPAFWNTLRNILNAFYFSKICRPICLISSRTDKNRLNNRNYLPYFYANFPNNYFHLLTHRKERYLYKNIWEFWYQHTRIKYLNFNWGHFLIQLLANFAQQFLNCSSSLKIHSKTSILKIVLIIILNLKFDIKLWRWFAQFMHSLGLTINSIYSHT